MKTSYKKREFIRLFDEDFSVISEIIFEDCFFRNSAFSYCESPDSRSVARDLEFINCGQRRCIVEAGILDNVLINNLETDGQLLQFFGTALRHVKLEGEIGPLMFSSCVDLLGKNPARQEAFDLANKSYYKGVDWALDIKDAYFGAIDLRGIPGNLVRRDEESQGLVLKSDLADGQWANLEFEGTHWRTTLEMIRDSKWDAGILAVPRLHRDAETFQKVLNVLRAEGFAR